MSKTYLKNYNARWYDPSLGRFAQADSIIPPGVQGLDRYAYVNNSPMNYVDPSGHEPKGTGSCYESQNYNGHWGCVPQGLTKDGSDALDGLETLAGMDNSWWNQDEDFTEQEKLAILLYQEVSIAIYSSCSGCNYELESNTKIAVTAKWQQYCGEGWNSTSCLNTFWGYYQAITDVSSDIRLQDKYFNTDLHNVLPYGDVFIREAGSVISSQIITRTNDTPIGWATVSDKGTVASALSVGVVYRRDYPGSIFFVVTGRQQDLICEKINRNSGCNLSNIP